MLVTSAVVVALTALGFLAAAVPRREFRVRDVHEFTAGEDALRG